MSTKPSSKALVLVPQEIIESKIYLIRGKKILLDRDLASLYCVETAHLKRAVRRNIDRFPDDFMFTLSKQELENWRCQFGTSNSDKMGLRYPPIAFTEQGVAMLSSVLNSNRAVHVNIQIMRAFVRIRECIAAHKDLHTRMDELESKLKHDIEEKCGIHDEQFKTVFRAFEEIKELLDPQIEKRKRKIGFHP